MSSAEKPSVEYKTAADPGVPQRLGPKFMSSCRAVGSQQEDHGANWVHWLHVGPMPGSGISLNGNTQEIKNQQAQRLSWNRPPSPPTFHLWVLVLLEAALGSAGVLVKHCPRQGLPAWAPVAFSVTPSRATVCGGREIEKTVTEEA